MLTFAVPAISGFLGKGNVSIDLASGVKQAKKAMNNQNSIFPFFIIQLKFRTAKREAKLQFIGLL